MMAVWPVARRESCEGVRNVRRAEMLPLQLLRNFFESVQVLDIPVTATFQQI